MSDWQPPPSPPGPPAGSGPPPGGFAPPGPPPGQAYGPPPGSGGPPPPPPGQYGYGQPGAYPAVSPAYGGPPFAGFWVRFGAAIIDGLVTAVIPVIAVIALAAGPKRIDRGGCTINNVRHDTCRVPSGATWAIFAVLLAASVLFAIYYYVFLVGRTGQTVGRKALGIKVVDKATGLPIGPARAFVRMLVRSVASGAICGLGYLWMLWDEEKQTWHDKVANSYVITT